MEYRGHFRAACIQYEVCEEYFAVGYLCSTVIGDQLQYLRHMPISDVCHSFATGQEVGFVLLICGVAEFAMHCGVPSRR